MEGPRERPRRGVRGGEAPRNKKSKREVSPRERSGDGGAPASERVGGSAGAKPPGVGIEGPRE